MLVRVREPRQDLAHDVDRARDLEAALLGDHVVQALAAHELHHDVRLVAWKPKSMIDTQCGCSSRAISLRLALEPLAAFIAPGSDACITLIATWRSSFVRTPR